MSENKHTPEPWRTAERSGFPFHIDDARGESVAMMLADDDHDEQRGLDNANRIVACINACAGIDTLILRAAAARLDHGRRARNDAERWRDGRAPGRTERRSARAAGDAGPAERRDLDRRRGGRALQAAARGWGLTPEITGATLAARPVD